MQTLITYGSRYGSARQYAQEYAGLCGSVARPFGEVKSIAGYDRVVHFGALYAGGVMGIKYISSLLGAQTELVIVTVGLADITDEENINNIRRSVLSALPRGVIDRTRIYHLRGAIDYGRLSLGHRTMMALLYAKAKGLPREKQNAETRALIGTYGGHVSFVDADALRRLADEMDGADT